MSDSTDRFPPGWDEERVRGLVRHYDSLTDEEWVADDDAAFEDTSHSVMVVPNELVPAVRALLSEHDEASSTPAASASSAAVVRTD